MRPDKAEQKSALFIKNSFLGMYVFNNSQIESDLLPNAIELCDVLVSFHGMLILIEVKRFDEGTGQSAQEQWFKNRIVYEARKQLTRGYSLLVDSKKWRVFDKRTKETIVRGPLEAIMTVAVFERDDIDNDTYPKVMSNDNKRVGANIFSLPDFQMATEMVPTPLDFFLFLQHRYQVFSQHSFPLVGAQNDAYIFHRVVDEGTVIAAYLLEHTKEGEHDASAAKALHEMLVAFPKNNDTVLWLDEMSCITIEIAQEIVKMRDSFSDSKGLVWNGQFISSGINDRKNAIAVLHSKDINTTLASIGKARRGIEKDGYKMGFVKILLFVFHEDGILRVFLPPTKRLS